MHDSVLVIEPHIATRRAIAALIERATGLEAVPLPDRSRVLRAVKARRVAAIVANIRALPLGPLPARPVIIALGGGDHPDYAARARRVGADAYVFQDDALVELPPMLIRLIERSRAAQPAA